MKTSRPIVLSDLHVALLSTLTFALPVGLFLWRFWDRAAFLFMAEDAFYYLSIALHSARVPFFSIDAAHPTNGFHPLWEWLLYALSKWPIFDLTGASVLPRLFTVNLVIVATAVGLFSVYVYRLTYRPWLSIVAFCPGLLWMTVGLGAPAYFASWAFINGMETGVELLFLSLSLLLLGSDFRGGARYFAGILGLGFVVLCRLDDVFFLFAAFVVVLLRCERHQWQSRVLAFIPAALMIVAYLLYNHHSLGVWLPVSGMAKAGKGLSSSIKESAHLLGGWHFFDLPSFAIPFSFGNTYVMVAQMLAPVAVGMAWLVWLRQTNCTAAPVVQALIVGVFLKGAYNFLRVPIGYQGAWYYGASVATANVLIALFLSDALNALTTAGLVTHTNPSFRFRWLSGPGKFVLLLCGSFLSFNIVASRAVSNGFDPKLQAWNARAQIREALQRSTKASFLEFQDGELSFITGLPAMSGFGLATDPEAVRAQHDGTYFDLLRRRGVTIAAASNTYPGAISQSAETKSVFPIWGFNRTEISQYCFEPFWREAVSNTVLYYIRHQPVCPAGVP